MILLPNFGEHLCEVTFTDTPSEPGELQSPNEVLAIAENWATTALGHIQTHITDFVAAGGTDTDARALPYSITTDFVQLVYGQRSSDPLGHGGRVGSGRRCLAGVGALRRLGDPQCGPGGRAGEPHLADAQ